MKVSNKLIVIHIHRWIRPTKRSKERSRPPSAFAIVKSSPTKSKGEF